MILTEPGRNPNIEGTRIVHTSSYRKGRMERSRSKRGYYDDQDSDSQTPPPRTKTRYHNNHHYGGSGGHHRRSGDRRHSSSAAPPPSAKLQENNPAPSTSFTTSYRILCPDLKVGGVIGKSGSIIKAFRQETGAWINVHPLVSGDEERIIEASDSRRREPDGRPPMFSPAQEALILIHERILDAGYEYGASEEDEEFGGGDSRGRDRERGGRVTTRLVVPRLHVGCLMGKGGKIIEQMRMETKTHIRILPRDQNMPRCVSMTEEIVQIVGESNAVKKAVVVISDRLKESLHRDRGPFRGRQHSPERFFSPDDEFITQRSDGLDSGPRSVRARKSSYSSRASGFAFDSDVNTMAHHAQSISYEDLVFRILCPSNKVESVMGESDGIVEMLRVDIGVNVKVTDPVPGSDERIITISSDEGPEDELFPAQEALLHIQSHIVDLGPDKDNIITTRLLVPSSEIGCLEGRDGSLSDLSRLTSANIQVLQREDHPLCALGADELVQIVGEIRAARDALVQITARLRSYLYHEVSIPKDVLPPSITVPGHPGSTSGPESISPKKNSCAEGYQGDDLSATAYQNLQTATTAWPGKDAGGCGNGLLEQQDSNIFEEAQQSANRCIVPVVTKSTLEVIIPQHAVPSLLMRSGNKLAQISGMSGASVSFLEDRPELPEKVIQISGSPEQAERAQSLLQGFILSTQEDIPAS